MNIVTQSDRELRDRYLTLMKHCLSGYLFIDEEAKPLGWGWSTWRARMRARLSRSVGQAGHPLLKRLAPRPLSATRAEPGLRRATPAWVGAARRLRGPRNVRLVRIGGDRAQREVGRDWPPNAATMVGLRRLENVQDCVTRVIQEQVPGDLIETGVWRGGTTIFMRALLAAFGEANRRVWVADSFQGLPLPDDTNYPADAGQDLSIYPELAIHVEDVKANFEKYELLDDQVRFLVGWFKDTLPTAPVDKLAVIRLDGDLYQSTMDALASLYPKLSISGFVIVDDYGAFPSCRQAVMDYREAHGITEEMVTVDWTGMYWRRLR